MKYIIESISEMNFNYLYLDEKCLSYNQLLQKFVISNDQVSQVDHVGDGRDRSNTMSNNNKSSNNKRHESLSTNNSSNSKNDTTSHNSDSYYNVNISNLNIPRA